MSLIQPKQIVKQKQVHKMSDVFLHATEKQCSTFFARLNEKTKEKSYCAIGLLGLYSGHDYSFKGGIGGCPNASSIEKKFNMKCSSIITCPKCSNAKGNLYSMLPHLNNDVGMGGHNMTFKQIGQCLKDQGY